MLVVVDANIVVKNPRLQGDKWDAARDAIRADRLRLVLPETARLEAVGAFHRAHETKILELKRILRRSSGRARDAAQGLQAVYQQEIDEYETILSSRLTELGIEIANVPSHSHTELTQRAIGRMPPFDEDGGGYRDTLLWLSALEQLDEPPFDNLVLVSDDGIFSKSTDVLAGELRQDFGAALRVVRRIEQLDFPGEYDEGEFSLEDTSVETTHIVNAIIAGLQGSDISRWSPPGVDHATVHVVGSVNLADPSVEVRKQYGRDVYELYAEATADVDARILIIHDGDGDGDDLDFSEMSARWDLHLRWRGKTAGSRLQLSEEHAIEVFDLDERPHAN